ncbi:MAG: AzlC family ABC transporter permease [Micromonosporaceae bacterium]
MGLAVAFVGASFGAVATAAGLPAWAVIAMSAFVFAGGSQFLVIGLLAAGSPVGAVFGGLLLNARHLPFGLAVADVIDTSWPRRLVGAHILVDESVAFALAETDPSRRRRAYWLTGGVLFIAWQIGTVAGVRLGTAVGDPAAYGLDAAFPAALLALILPSLRRPDARRVALLAAALAVPASFFLPAGLPILIALLGLLAAGRAEPGPAPERTAPA